MGISIVIPAYNAQRYLPQTLESVLAQTTPDWDLTIVDDGSRDDTPAIADRLASMDARVRVVHQENRGLADSRNIGLAASSAQNPLVLFLDADDLLAPDALGVLGGMLADDPSAEAAHGAADLIDEEGRAIDFPDVSSRRAVPRGSELVPAGAGEPTSHAMLAVDNCVQSVGACAIRKSAISVAGPFDQSIAAVADHDMWFRLTRRAPMLFTSARVLKYRVHGASMSGSRSVMRSAGLRMRRKWIARGDASERALVRLGYRLAVRGTARRQRQALWGHLRARQWGRAMRALPLAAFCAAKTLPGIPSLILNLGPRE